MTYRKRFQIETFFGDQKSRGFGMDKSHLSHPERLSKLFFVACLAFLWMVFLGLEVIEQECGDQIYRTHRRDKSFFRLGVDRLTHCLKFGYPIDIGFTIPFLETVR